MRGDTGLGLHDGLGGGGRLGNEFAIPGKIRGVPVEFPVATEIQTMLDAKTAHFWRSRLRMEVALKEVWPQISGTQKNNRQREDTEMKAD